MDSYHVFLNIGLWSRRQAILGKFRFSWNDWHVSWHDFADLMNNQTQVIANLLFDLCFLRNDFLFKNLNILHICRVSYSIILFIVYFDICWYFISTSNDLNFHKFVNITTSFIGNATFVFIYFNKGSTLLRNRQY